MGSWAAARQLGHEGRHENHYKCQDATTTTTTTVWYLFSYKKTHKNFQREREREKKAPTPNIVLSSCANGMGQKLQQRKVCNGWFFSFHNGCCPFVLPPPKKKNIHNIGFVYLFVYIYI
jgi:hypothetical protein